MGDVRLDEPSTSTSAPSAPQAPQRPAPFDRNSKPRHGEDSEGDEEEEGEEEEEEEEQKPHSKMRLVPVDKLTEVDPDIQGRPVYLLRRRAVYRTYCDGICTGALRRARAAPVPKYRGLCVHVRAC
jgi:hypothetical protein